MTFWKWKQQLNSEEYEKLFKKLTDLSFKIEETEGKIKVMRTDVDNLRGNFNRKLKGITKEETDEEKTETQNINNPMFIPFNGSFK